MPQVGVVHLNSIPVQCKKGGHVDRHSTDYIRECSNGGKKLVDVAKLCEKWSIPYILERRETIYSYDDIEFLRESW